MYRYNKQALAFEKVNMNLLGIKIALACIAISIVTGFAVAPRASIKNLTQEEKIILVREYNEFTEAKLVEEIKQLNFKFPYIILAQSYQETGHYKSGIFLSGNNLFGMKEAKTRATLAQGTQRDHAYYKTWQESLYDYALFYSTYLSSIKTEGEYYGYLEQHYAQDPNYVQRIKSIVVRRNLKKLFK